MTRETELFCGCGTMKTGGACPRCTPGNYSAIIKQAEETPELEQGKIQINTSISGGLLMNSKPLLIYTTHGKFQEKSITKENLSSYLELICQRGMDCHVKKDQIETALTLPLGYQGHIPESLGEPLVALRRTNNRRCAEWGTCPEKICAYKATDETYTPTLSKITKV